MGYRENFALIDFSRKIPAPVKKRLVSKRSDLPAPMLIGDEMPPTQHQCNGEILTSKAAFRAITKAHGCVEVGNDRLPPKQRSKPSRAEAKRTVTRAAARVERGERYHHHGK